MEDLADRLYNGVDMLLSKAEKIMKYEDAMTIDELGKTANILKDISEIHENLAKAHVCYTEHAVKRY